MTVVGGARVEFEGDASAIADDLEKAMKRAADAMMSVFEDVFSDMDDTADRGGRNISASMQEAGSRAARAFDDLDGTQFDRIGESARQAASDVERGAGRQESAIDRASRAARNGADAQDDLGDAARRAAQDQEDAAQAAGALGEQMGGLGGKAAGAVAGLAAAGGAAALITESLSRGADSNKLAASLGESADVAAEYGALAGTLYSNNFGDTIEDVNTAIGAISSSYGKLGDIGEEEMNRLSQHALTFSSVFGTDINEAVQTTSQMLVNGLATDGEQAFDMLTTAFQNVPAAMRDELPEIINEYGTSFRALGFDGEDSFNVLVQAANNGKWALDKAGDSLKEFTIRSTDGSKASTDAFEALGLNAQQMATDIATGGPPAQAALQETIDKLLQIEDPAERAQTAIALFGTPLEDLSIDKIPQFLSSLQGGADTMGDFEGSAQQMADTVASGPQAALDTFTRGLQTGLVEVMGRVVGYLMEHPALMYTLAGAIGAVATAYIGLRVAATVAAVAQGAMAVASGAGTAALAGNTVALGAYAIATGVARAASAAWTGVQWLLNAALSANPIGLVVIAIAALAAGVVIAYQKSETFRNIVQSLWEKVQEAWGGIKAAFGEGVAWVGDKLEQARAFIERIPEAVQGIPDRVRSAFSDAGQWLKDAGRNVVQGFIDGVKSLAGRIADTFLNLMPGWIRGPFKKALGIESPSKLFAGFGQDTGQGYIGGLEDTAADVENSARGLAENAAAAFSEVRAAATGGDDGYGALGGFIGDDLARAAVNAVPVIAPPPPPPSVAPEGADAGLVGAAPGLVPPDPEVVTDAFTAAGQGIEAARSGLIDPAVAGMQAGVDHYAQSTQAQMAEQVVPAWQNAGTAVTGIKASLFDPAQAGMQASMVQTGATTQSAMLGTVLPAMQTAGTGIAAVQTGTVDPALASMRGAVANTQSAFASGASGINAEWNRIRAGTADPARFVISTVFNDGIVSMWNGVSDMIGTKKMAPHPVGFASGTSQILPGYTPGRDPYTFIEPNTGMTIGLSGGEGIARPELVKAVGSDRWDSLNAAAKMGGVAAVQRSLGQFAGGGVVGSITGLVNKYFPGMSITSTQRNTPDLHGQGLAVDFSNGTDTTPQMQAAARFFHKHYARGLLELIHWPLNGWQNIDNGVPYDFGPATNAQHRNHVHVAAARPLPPPGGLVVPVPSGGGAAPVDWRAMVGEMMQPEVDKVRGRIGGAAFPGIVGQMPGKTFDAMLKPMQDTITKKMEESGGSAGGGGADQWRGLAMQALARHGYNPAQHIDAMLKQIQIESGGIPSAINNWDSNAAIGTPSGGLLQVIEPTYRRVRNAYPEAFVGLPDNHMTPLTNLTAGVGAVRMDWGGPQGRWPTTGGYDQGGLAVGEGFLQKKIVDPERVLDPQQTKAFEAWLAAGQNVDGINDLVASVQQVRLDAPEAMAADVAARLDQWMSESSGEGDVRALAAALQTGVEWQRVTDGMQKSAEAWANGDWVRVAEGKRLATPEEMATQVREDFLSELAGEFGGLVGAKNLYKGRDLVPETGLMDLPKPESPATDAVKVPDASVDSAAAAVATAGGTGTAGAGAGTGTADAAGTTTAAPPTTVNLTLNVNGVQDPMTVKDLVMRDMGRGLETAMGTARSR